VNTIFLQSLVQSAEDFLGKKIQGAVISVPASFTEGQKAALEKAMTETGVTVYQLLDEAAAVSVTTTNEIWSSSLNPDRTQLVVDVGSSSLSLSLLSLRDGLAHVLASSSTLVDVGGNQVDDKLVKFFATEFTKKTKTPLSVCAGSTDRGDARAEAKLRLAVEHTKRTLSASPGAATCSVESLKDGLDFTGSVNRLRFDMLCKPVYASITAAVTALLGSIQFDPYEVDEIVYVGGTTCLPGLDEHLFQSGGFNDNISTPFTQGTVVGGGVGDPTTILARGCAIQAALISSIAEDEAELREGFEKGNTHTDVKVLPRTIALFFPDSTPAREGTWIPTILKDTPLPTRRTIYFDIGLTENSKHFAFEVWEISEGYRVEKQLVAVDPLSDDEGEPEEPEEVEIKHRLNKKENLLATAHGEALLAIKTKGAGPDRAKWATSVEAQVVVLADGKLEIAVKEIGKDGASIRLVVSP
jgi:molecular chaperone DnaK (HSP70)